MVHLFQQKRWGTIVLLILIVSGAQGGPVIAESSSAVIVDTSSDSLEPTPAVVVESSSTLSSSSSSFLARLPSVASSVFTNIKEASIESWESFQTCRRVRQKISLYKAELKEKWKDDYEPTELRKKLKGIQGGCSFEEYQFLQRAKRDRFKLLYLTSFVANKSNWITLVALNVVYPSFIYPAPFIKKLRGNRCTVVGETREESVSRHRSLMLREFLLQVEKTARSNSNPEAQRLYKLSRLALEQNPMSTNRFLRAIEPLLFSKEKGTKGLKVLPATVFRSLGKMIQGPVGGVPFGIPGIANSIVNEHLRVLEVGDRFLVSNSIPLESLSTDGLLESCEDRFIDTAGASRADLEASLQSWLDTVEVQPKTRISRTQEMYNGNLGRAAVLCHNAITTGCNDPAAVATLPIMKTQTLSIEK